MVAGAEEPDSNAVMADGAAAVTLEEPSLGDELAMEDVIMLCDNKLLPRLPPGAEILLIPNPYLSSMGLEP